MIYTFQHVHTHTHTHTHINTSCVQLLQELTEEGLPFVVLFHHPEDHNSVRQFKEVVESELMSETGNDIILCHYCS